MMTRAINSTTSGTQLLQKSQSQQKVFSFFLCALFCLFSVAASTAAFATTDKRLSVLHKALLLEGAAAARKGTSEEAGSDER